MSLRVTSSGYMPPVYSKRPRRRSLSSMPKRAAMPGRCQTGSMAALVTRASPPGPRMRLSLRRRFSSRAALSSGMLMRALVTAMVGRMSIPVAILSAKLSLLRCPQGSSETMRAGSDHWGNGPIASAGAVSVKSGTCTGLRLPAATARAR